MKALVLVASLVSSISTNDDITYKISTTARYYQCYQHQCNLLLISTSATNASAFSNSAVSTSTITTCPVSTGSISASAITTSAVESYHDDKQGRLHGHQEAQGGGASLPLLLLGCER